MTTEKKDLKRADELMTIYAQSKANLDALNASIANEVKAYKQNMKDAESELVKIAEDYLHLFEDDNLLLTDGYVHIASKSVVDTTKKFKWSDFLEQKGDLAKVTFELAKVKKAWLDTDQHNELIELGVQLDTVRDIEVIVHKKAL